MRVPALIVAITVGLLSAGCYATVQPRGYGYYDPYGRPYYGPAYAYPAGGVYVNGYASPAYRGAYQAAPRYQGGYYQGGRSYAPPPPVMQGPAVAPVAPAPPPVRGSVRVR